MIRHPAFVFLLGPILFFAAIWTFCDPAPAKSYAPGRQPERLPDPLAAPQWLGAGSCAAASCHGGDDPPGSWRSAHHTWITRDPHARAYQALFNEQSRRIMTHRGGKEAHKDTLCLSCHVHPDWRSEDHHERYAVADGVGCESCHGPAERWLSRHVAADWPTLSAAEKSRLGWKDTKSLATRAEVCATCHVGTDKADVNHDLIAAGHPALKFELSAYHAAMPAHWDAAKDWARYPDFEPRVWRIGQVVSAKAALELLAGRAGDAARPWPEFAEHDCAACHHDLRPDAAGGAARKPAAAGRSPWYTSLVSRAGGVADLALADLDMEMAKLLPARARIVKDSRALAARLQGVPERIEARAALRPEELLDQFRLLSRSEAKRASRTWDEAAQLYRALVAHANGWRAMSVRAAHEDTLRSTLRALAKQLALPPGGVTPRHFDPPSLLRRLEVLGRLGAH